MPNFKRIGGGPWKNGQKSDDLTWNDHFAVLFYNDSRFYTRNNLASFKKHQEQLRCCGAIQIPNLLLFNTTAGHTLSWGYGTDHLLTPCYNYAERPNGFYGPVNPILKWTYTLMQRLFAEVMELFPDSSIHLGGDEVPYECW